MESVGRGRGASAWRTSSIERARASEEGPRAAADSSDVQQPCDAQRRRQRGAGAERGGN